MNYKAGFWSLALFFLLGMATASMAAQSLGALTLTQVTPRIFTPNGDSFNDVVFFQFDNTLSGLPLDSAIFDINGAKVASLTRFSSERALTWDGKDDQGRSLPSGIYIYSIKLGQNEASGTIVVAR